MGGGGVKERNVKKRVQTEAGVALDDCDRPFKTAPRGQRMLAVVLFHADLFVLEREESKRFCVKAKSKIYCRILRQSVSKQRGRYLPLDVKRLHGFF